MERVAGEPFELPVGAKTRVPVPERSLGRFRVFVFSPDESLIEGEEPLLESKLKKEAGRKTGSFYWLKKLLRSHNQRQYRMNWHTVTEFTTAVHIVYDAGEHRWEAKNDAMWVLHEMGRAVVENISDPLASLVRQQLLDGSYPHVRDKATVTTGTALSDGEQTALVAREGHARTVRLFLYPILHCRC